MKGAVELLSVSKISKLLSTRHIFSTPKIDERIQPHPKWDIESKAAIVILWGLLIYPQLDPDLKKKSKAVISSAEFLRFFMEYLEDKRKCYEILELLNRFDYIRLKNNQIVPGTGLYISVDAAKMYPLFRSSVLARKLFKKMKW